MAFIVSRAAADLFAVLLAVSLCQFIIVQAQSSGDLRLNYFGSTIGRSSGRLEVYYSGQWGTVCDDSFSPNDARVACRQLGYSTYSRYGSVGTLGFSQGSSFQRIWLDDLLCTGSESRLVNCRHNGYGIEDCSHSEDVGLVCSGTTTTTTTSGSLRLVGGSSSSRGRLEVYYSGQWGTVCDDLFSPNDARVACRQLGYSTYSRYGSVGSLGFSQGSILQRIWLDNLGCSGSESRLVNCRHNGYGIEDCSHSEDVGLICSSSTTTNPVTGDLRLVSSSGSTGGSAGRLEVYYSGQWGTVCDDSFTSNDANVACRQLGYSRAYCYGRVGSLGYSQASSSTRTWLDNLRCTSTDTSLLNCAHNGVGVEDCSHYEDIALVCSYRSTCTGFTSGGSSGGGGTYYGGYYYGGGGVSGTVFLVVCCCICCCVGFKKRRTRTTTRTTTTPCVRPTTTTVVATSSRTTVQQPTIVAAKVTSFSVVGVAKTGQEPPTAYTQQKQNPPPNYPSPGASTLPYPSNGSGAYASSNTLPAAYPPAEPVKSDIGFYPDAPPPYPAQGFDHGANPAYPPPTQGNPSY